MGGLYPSLFCWLYWQLLGSRDDYLPLWLSAGPELGESVHKQSSKRKRFAFGFSGCPVGSHFPPAVFFIYWTGLPWCCTQETTRCFLRHDLELSATGCVWGRLTVFLNWFLLEYSCFTVLCYFLLYHKVDQPSVYIYSLFFGLPSHSGHFF